MLKSLLSISMLAALSTACDQKEEKQETESTTPAGTVAGGGSTTTSTSGSLASATDVGDLKLTSAFSFKLPAALEGEAAASLNLLAGKKSQEACQMGSTIREVTSQLEEIGNFFCHLEVEKERMVFGKKYLINTNGVEFARLYVDNSAIAEGKISIGFCSKHGDEEANKQLITIDSLSASGPKGSVVNLGTGSYEGQANSWASSVTFDMSAAGIVDLIAEQLHSQDTNSFRRKVELVLAEAGMSHAKLAAKGTWGGNSFLERGAAMFDGTYGSAIFQSQGTHEGQTFSFARRAYFNEPGEVVASSAVPAAVIPPVTDLPAFLAETFEPTAPSGWVGGGCADYDEVIDLNPESEAHAACDSDRNDNHVECWSQDTYESGTENVEVD
jgi:hypothetical protein